VTVIKDEKTKPAVVDNHVAKDTSANKEKPAETPKNATDSPKKGTTAEAKEDSKTPSSIETPQKKNRPNLEVGINKLKLSEKMQSEEVQSPFRRRKT
jgi:hypothetical protein